MASAAERVVLELNLMYMLYAIFFLILRIAAQKGGKKSEEMVCTTTGQFSAEGG